MKYLLQILGIQWHEHVSNMDILSRTGLCPLADHIARQRTATFGDIARLADGIPAHQALKCQVYTSVSCHPSQHWTHQHPRNKWLDQLRPNSSLYVCLRSGSAQFVEIMVLE